MVTKTENKDQRSSAKPRHATHNETQTTDAYTNPSCPKWQTQPVAIDEHLSQNGCGFCPHVLGISPKLKFLTDTTLCDLSMLQLAKDGFRQLDGPLPPSPHQTQLPLLPLYIHVFSFFVLSNFLEILVSFFCLFLFLDFSNVFSVLFIYFFFFTSFLFLFV